MELFIFVFGVIYFVFKIFSEKGNKLYYEGERKKIKDVEAKIRDISLQYNIKSAISKSASKREQYLSDIAEDMEFIFGESWREQFPKSLSYCCYPEFSGCFYDFRTNWDILLHVKMSQLGYVCYDGLPTYSLGCYSDDRIQEVIRTCQVIEKNISKKYEGVYLVCSTRYEGDYKYQNELRGRELRWNYYPADKPPLGVKPPYRLW